MRGLARWSKILSVVTVVSLVLLPTVVFAEAPPTLYTAIQVMNLSDSETANIAIAYYNANGTLASAGISDSIGPNQFKSFDANQNKPPDLPLGFRGAAVLSSDQPVGAIVGMGNTDGGTYVAEAYRGFPSAETASTMLLPIVLKSIVDKGLTFSTQFSIQNAGVGDAAGTITYYPMGGGTPIVENFSALKAGAALVIDAKTDANLTAGTFIGSVKVVATSGNPLAVTAMQYGEKAVGAGRTLQLYPGFPGGAGSDKVISPLLLKMVPSSAYVYSTAIQVTNVDASAVVTAHVVYHPAGGGADIVGPQRAIAAGQFASFDQSQDSLLPNGWVGSGEIVRDSGASNALVGIVGQGGTFNGVYSRAFYFAGFKATDGAAKWKAPLTLKAITDGPNTWSTAVQVMDVSGSPNTIQVTYRDLRGGSPIVFSRSCGANALCSFDPVQAGTSGLDGVADFVGSAVIETLSAGNFVVYVGQGANNAGDAAEAYVPFK